MGRLVFADRGLLFVLLSLLACKCAYGIPITLPGGQKVQGRPHAALPGVELSATACSYCCGYCYQLQLQLSRGLLQL